MYLFTFSVGDNSNVGVNLGKNNNNNNNVYCSTRIYENEGKTYADSEYEIYGGGKKVLRK